MIYQYDQAVQLPVKDLYDTQVMQMAIAAARDMYEKGEKQIKDVYDKFGDFYSPVPGRTEQIYDETVGKIQREINKIYESGDDPLRSISGRRRIAQLSRSINIGLYNRAKAEAEGAKEYLKNRGILDAKNKYNPEYEKAILGGKTFETWDINNDGWWTRTSPAEYDDLNSMTTHWFDKINKDSYLRTDKEGYDYFGVKPEDLASVMDQQMPDFINSQYGKYQLELARKQLGGKATDAEAIEQLKRNIISANKEVTINPTRKLNPLKQLELSDYYDALKQKRAFQYSKELERYKNPQNFDANGNPIPGNAQTQGGPTPWSTMKDIQVSENIKEKLFTGNNGNNFKSTVQKIVSGLQEKLNELKEKYTKRVQDGYTDETEEKLVYRPMPGQGLSTEKVTKRVPKYKEELSPEYEKTSKELTEKLNRYNKLLQGKSVEMSVDDIYNDYMSVYDGKSSIGKDNSDLVKEADSLWSLFEVDDVDEHDKAISIKTFSGNGDLVEISDIPGKYRQVSFNQMNMNYTPTRRVGLLGGARFGKNAFQRQFDEWLHNYNPTGYMLDTTVRHANIPKKSRSGDRTIRQHDFSGRVSISADDFLEFYNSIPEEDKKGWTVNEVANYLGLMPRTKAGKRYDSAKGDFAKYSYFDVPVTRTVESNSYELSGLNKVYTHEHYGGSDAYKQSVVDESAALQ